jgi:helix-turn-helix protein
MVQMTALAGVSRATYYRFDPEATPAVRDTELRDAVQRIALRFPAYGRPRITAALKRQGGEANHKRVGASCARTTCCAFARRSSTPRRIPSMASGCIRT